MPTVRQHEVDPATWAKIVAAGRSSETGIPVSELVQMSSVAADCSEEEFTREVIAAAQLHGWRVAHFRPARTAKGWRTAVAGDGAGFPDLVLVRRGVLLVAELKTNSGRFRTGQREWLAAFQAANIPAHVWRPREWPDILAILGEPPERGAHDTISRRPCRRRGALPSACPAVPSGRPQ